MKMAYGVKVPESKCPNCGHKFDRAGHVSGHGESVMPSAGDISVCIECAAWLVYNADLSTRMMTAEDILEMPSRQHKELIILTNVIKKVQRAKARLKNK